MNVYGYGNFFTNGNYFYYFSNGFFTNIKENINIHFNNIDGIIYLNIPQNPLNGCNLDIKGKRIKYDNYNCIYLNLSNLNCKVDIDIIQNNSVNFETVYLSCTNYNLFFKFNKIVNESTTNYSLKCTNTNIYGASINGKMLISGQINKINITTINDMVINNNGFSPINVITSNYIERVEDYSITSTRNDLYSNINSFFKYGESVTNIYNNQISQITNWIFDSGITNLHCTFNFNTEASLSYSDYFTLNGNDVVNVYGDIYNNANVLIVPTPNLSIFTINGVSNILNIFGNISTKTYYNNIVNLKNGKVYIKGDLTLNCVSTFSGYKTT